MSKGGNSEGASRLAGAIRKIANIDKNDEFVLDFGLIQDDKSLLTNTFPIPIPKGDYQKTGSVKKGDRVLVGWVGGDDAVVIGKLRDAEEEGGGDGVESVNGKTGAVTLDYSDVGAAAANHNHDADYLKLSGGTMTGQITYESTIDSETSFQLFAAKSTDDTKNRAAIWTEADHAISFVERLKSDNQTEVYLLPTPTESTYGRYHILTDRDAVTIEQGGTGKTNRAEAMDALANLGKQPITSTADDTPANWRRMNFGMAWYSTASMLNGQPTQYGFLMNMRNSMANTDVHQIWAAQNHGSLYHRGGNSSGWGDTEWKLLLDNGNYKNIVTPANIGAAAASHNHTLSQITNAGSMAAKDADAYLAITALAANTDLNNVRTYGLYTVGGWSNMSSIKHKPASDYACLMVLPNVDTHVGAYCLQYWFGRSGLWRSDYSNGTWSVWTNITTGATVART